MRVLLRRRALTPHVLLRPGLVVSASWLDERGSAAFSGLAMHDADADDECDDDHADADDDHHARHRMGARQVTWKRTAAMMMILTCVVGR
eukprot:1182122-Rhodomonas_salina.1